MYAYRSGVDAAPRGRVEVRAERIVRDLIPLLLLLLSSELLPGGSASPATSSLPISVERFSGESHPGVELEEWPCVNAPHGEDTPTPTLRSCFPSVLLVPPLLYARPRWADAWASARGVDCSDPRLAALLRDVVRGS